MSQDQNIQELRDALREQAELLERISADPLDTATVVSVSGQDVLIAASGGATTVIQQPDNLVAGESILIMGKTKQFIRYNPFQADSQISMVSEIVDDFALVGSEGRERLVPAHLPMKAGDRVVLDHTGSVILRVLPRDAKEYAVPATGVQWSDIGGNEAAKRAMIEAIENPHKYRELYAHYGAKGAKGILLYGPPGCGKTMLGKAAATSIGASEGFIYCKGPEVLDPYVGVAEATVRSLFNRAREFQSEQGKRAVIFIDEAEALLGNRGARYAHMEKTIVPTFLAEMDGVEDSGAVVILATNRNMALDPAVVRDGRVDRRIEIGRPTQSDSREIVFSHLKNAPTVMPKQELADHLVDAAWASHFTNAGREFGLPSFASGSLFAGIVEKAKNYAMRRDIAASTQTGLCTADLDDGLALTLTELKATSLEELS